MTEKPFPTAFFLLIEVAFLGAFAKEVIEGQFNKDCFLWLFGYSQLTLIVSVFFSYEGMFFHYICAYNAGIILIWIACRYNIDWKPFKKLGVIGFPFFLGADIPYIFIEKWIDLSGTVYKKIVGCVLKFILAVLFAYIITKYIEEPLQNVMKKIRGKLIEDGKTM